MQSIFHDTVVSVQKLNGAADNEAVTGDGVDMQGYSGVAFVAVAAANEAKNFTLKAQEDDDSAYGTAADLTGTSITFATTTLLDGVGVLEVVHPKKRYIRPVLTCPNVTAGGAVAIIAIKYGNVYLPETNTGEFHQTPVAGTA